MHRFACWLKRGRDSMEMKVEKGFCIRASCQYVGFLRFAFSDAVLQTSGGAQSRCFTEKPMGSEEGKCVVFDRAFSGSIRSCKPSRHSTKSYKEPLKAWPFAAKSMPNGFFANKRPSLA